MVKMSSKALGISSKSTRTGTGMTPTSMKVFHMLTSQDEKKEMVEQLQSGGIKKKDAISHFSMAAIDSTWVFDENWVMNPRSYVKKMWDVTITLLVFYLMGILPWELGVPFYHPPEPILILEKVLEGIFWFDMFVTLNTGFIASGEMELDRVEIIHHYVSSWFIIDLTGNFPFYAFIGHEKGRTVKILKWLKLNKLFRMGKLVRYMRDYVKFASIMKYVGVFTMSIHVATCITVGNIFTHDDVSHNGISYSSMYLNCLGQIISLAFSGNMRSHLLELTFAESTDDHAADDHAAATDDHHRYLSENVDVTRPIPVSLSIVFIIGGAILLVFIQAAVVVLLSNKSTSSMKFKLKIENMKTELDYYDIDEGLSSRIMEFYDYLWFNQLNQDENSVHKDTMLSAELRRELLLTIYSDMLMSTPFLTACSEECVYNVAFKLICTIAMPTDFIIRKGDIGRELFIIKKGMVGVFNDTKYLKTLHKGQYFGEVALLAEGPKKRTATIRAISVTELCLLYAKDFHDISFEYPELLHNMAQYMHATHMDTDLVKNPKVVGRRRTTVSNGGASGHHDKAGSFRGKHGENLAKTARKSLIDFTQSVRGMVSGKGSHQDAKKTRNLSYGTQLAGLINETFNSNASASVAPLDDDETHPHDAAKMIASLIEERMKTDDIEPTGDMLSRNGSTSMSGGYALDKITEYEHEEEPLLFGKKGGTDGKPLEMVRLNAMEMPDSKQVATTDKQVPFANGADAKASSQEIEDLKKMVMSLHQSISTTNNNLINLADRVESANSTAFRRNHSFGMAPQSNVGGNVMPGLMNSSQPRRPKPIVVEKSLVNDHHIKAGEHDDEEYEEYSETGIFKAGDAIAPVPNEKVYHTTKQGHGKGTMSSVDFHDRIDLNDPITDELLNKKDVDNVGHMSRGREVVKKVKEAVNAASYMLKIGRRKDEDGNSISDSCSSSPAASKERKKYVVKDENKGQNDENSAGVSNYSQGTYGADGVVEFTNVSSSIKK